MTDQLRIGDEPRPERVTYEIFEDVRHHNAWAIRFSDRGCDAEAVTGIAGALTEDEAADLSLLPSLAYEEGWAICRGVQAQLEKGERGIYVPWEHIEGAA